MADTKITFDAADDYERYMSVWSRAVGEKFLAWLAPPKNARWLDAGCGTGAFSEMIVKRTAPKTVMGIDPSPEQIAHARGHIPGVTFQLADAMALPFKDGEFDIVVSALVLHFIPDRAKAFAEMKRVLRPGGIVAAYTWERTSSAEFAPYAPMVHEFRKLGVDPIMSPLVPEQSPDGMQATLEKTGFSDIEVKRIEVSRTFRDFGDYWDTQALAFSPTGKTIAKLDAGQRSRLQDAMRAALPAATDGSVSHTSRAMAGKAKKAG